MKNILGSFATRLYIYITLVSVVVFGAIAAVSYYYNSKRDYDQASQTTILMLKDVIRSLDFQMAEAARNAEFFSTRIMSVRNNPDSLKVVLGEQILADTNTVGAGLALVPSRNGGRAFFQFIDMDSTGRYTYERVFDQTYDYTGRPWYSEALESRTAHWMDPYIDVGGDEGFVTSFTRPVKDAADSVCAVMVFDMSFVEFINDLEALRPYPESFFFVVSDDGTYLSHPDSELVSTQSIFERADKMKSSGLANVGRSMINGATGSKLISFNGEDNLVCYVPMRSVGWSVACVTPYSVVTKRLGMAEWMMLVIILVGLVALAIIINIIVRLTTRPLEDIIEASHHIASGDFSFVIPERSSGDDLGKVCKAFNDMQSSLQKYVDELTEITQNQQREQSMVDIAKTIQEGMLPRVFPVYPTRPEVDIYGRMLTGVTPSGTLYDFHTTKDHLFFILADVNGSELASYLMMVMTVSLFRSSVIQTDSPAGIISAINTLVCHNRAMSLTEKVFVGALELATGKFTYCNAGHRWPVVFGEENRPRRLDGKMQPEAGENPNVDYYNEEMKLYPGDVVVSFNEHAAGLSDHMGRLMTRDDLFNVIETILERGHNVSLQKVVNDILGAMLNHIDHGQLENDLVVMAMAFRQVSSAAYIRESISIKSDLNEIPSLSIFINDLSVRAGWDSSLSHKINIVLEEGVSNIITNAYPENYAGVRPEGTITLSVLTSANSVSLRLIDDGVPFDPTAEVKQAHDSLSDEDDKERLPSDHQALGYFLIHQIMDEVEYGRVNNRNQVIMRLYRK